MKIYLFGWSGLGLADANGIFILNDGAQICLEISKTGQKLTCITDNEIVIIPNIEWAKLTLFKSLTHSQFNSYKMIIKEAIEISVAMIIKGLWGFVKISCDF